MKRSILLTCFLFLILKSEFSFSQTKSNYIYIEIPGLTVDRGFPEFRQALVGISEIRSIQYCEKLGIAILQCNHHETNLEKNIAVALTKAHYKFHIKNPVAIESLVDVCNLHF